MRMGIMLVCFGALFCAWSLFFCGFPSVRGEAQINHRNFTLFAKQRPNEGLWSRPSDNPCLRDAYVAMQAWKKAITADPMGIVATWTGPDVCSYKGVFCAPPPPELLNPSCAGCNVVVAGIDLNHGGLEGTLVKELCHLRYLALFHINSNRFRGCVPGGIGSWTWLYELDLSNNLLEGGFPHVVLTLPHLAYLDIRFNRFTGPLPPELFRKCLDAVFVNDNAFTGDIPESLGESPASVAVLANNRLSGGIPESVVQMGETLEEVLFLGNALESCIPPHLGMLRQLTVLDLSFNRLSGELPCDLGGLASAELLNFAHNRLSGPVPDELCSLPHLQNLTLSFNFFTSEGNTCAALLKPKPKPVLQDLQNCIAGRPLQRPPSVCAAFNPTAEACSISKPPPTPSPSYY